MKVIELFAGVGGFRVGLNRVDENFFDTVWSNQFEPATKRQHASEVYVARFGSKGHVNADIATVKTEDIPDHDMLCGGFPCQDYSVARNLDRLRDLWVRKVFSGGKLNGLCERRGSALRRYYFWRMSIAC